MTALAGEKVGNRNKMGGEETGRSKIKNKDGEFIIGKKRFSPIQK